MRMVDCEGCGNRYPNNVPNCPNCSEKNKNYIKNRKQIGIVLFIMAGIFLSIAVYVFIANYDELSNSPQTTVQENTGCVNYQNFEKIKSGMSYEQVVEILGEEGKILAEADTDIADEYITTIYYWYDRTGIANCNVTFQNKKVIAKAQIGLR